MRRVQLLGAVLTLLAAGAPLGAHASTGATTDDTIRNLGEQIAAACQGASVVILGERHQESEGHALFLDLVDAFASRGDRLVVGLEIGSDRQADLEAAGVGPWPSDGLVPASIDSPSYRDLVRALLGLAARKGSRLKVRAIDTPRGSDRDRDAAMASQIDADLHSGACDRVVVLAGNLHALKDVPWAPEVRTPTAKLAGLLAKQGVGVASVVQQFKGTCEEPGRAAFFPAGSQAADGAVRGLWDTLHTDPARGNSQARAAADGAVCWTCGR